MRRPSRPNIRIFGQNGQSLNQKDKKRWIRHIQEFQKGIFEGVKSFAAVNSAPCKEALLAMASICIWVFAFVNLCIFVFVYLCAVNSRRLPANMYCLTAVEKWPQNNCNLRASDVWQIECNHNWMSNQLHSRDLKLLGCNLYFVLSTCNSGVS